MTTANKSPEINLNQLTCPKCGASAKRIITSAYNPHPEHGESIGLAHSIGARNTLQVEFECQNDHIEFNTIAFPHTTNGQ